MDKIKAAVLEVSDVLPDHGRVPWMTGTVIQDVNLIKLQRGRPFLERGIVAQQHKAGIDHILITARQIMEGLYLGSAYAVYGPGEYEGDFGWLPNHAVTFVVRLYSHSWKTRNDHKGKA